VAVDESARTVTDGCVRANRLFLPQRNTPATLVRVIYRN